MGSKTVLHTFETDMPFEQVKDAVCRSLMMLGGAQQDMGQMINITQGSFGVSNAFTAQIDAQVSIRQINERKYEVLGMINWKPASIVWICLGIGFFVFGILWVVPLLYLFVDPTPAYQQALYRIPSLLE